MLNGMLRSFDRVDCTQILKDQFNHQLLVASDRLADSLHLLGYPVRTVSETALLKLETTSSEKKAELTAHFDDWREVVQALDPRYSFENNRALLVRALKKHGLEVDDDFLKTIDQDHIVEFYGEDMVQLYRSFNFFKITGYSLLDISLHEWPLLWERPTQALQGIGTEVTEALENFIPKQKFKTKPHIVREIFNATGSKDFTPRAILLTPAQVGSLRSNRFDRNQKKGFICTSYGEVVALGDEAKTIHFI